MTSIDDERMLEKVRALLAKAEASTYAEEAEAFSAKAQQLMARYSIERAIIDGLDPVGGPEQRELKIPDPYAKAKFTLLDAVATPNRCEAIYRSSTRTGFIVGFPADLETVEVLYTSLLVQATGLMAAHGSVADLRGTNRTRSFRNSFLFGFAHAIGARFEQNRRSAETEADPGVLPVLVDRASQVDEKLSELFPNVSTMRSSVTNGAGVAAGQRAGAVADIGSSRLTSARASLSR